MSGAIKGSLKLSETAANQTGSSMHFWGVCCESGKQYAQVVGQRFRITMAVLDPKSFHNDTSERIVSLIVIRGGIEYLLCVLKHGEIHQVNLNLIFDKGENVKFYINGPGKVYLSGYQLTDSEGDVMNDENGYLCPLVEVKSKKKSKKNKVSSSLLETTEPVASTSKKNKNEVIKPFWSSFLSEDIGDDDDDESDDFVVGDEDISSSDIESEESEDITEDKLEINNEDSDDGEIQNFNESRKRRKREESPAQKRARKDSSSSVDSTEDIICIDDSELDAKDTSFNVNSAGNTPMPKKHRKKNDETPPSEKMLKKEKQIQEIIQSHNLGKFLQKEKIETSPSKPSSASKSPMPLTPKSPMPTPKSSKRAVENSSKSNYQKLEGGIEIQDVIIGKGPAAVNGKVVSIFFVGCLPDNSVFDSRTRKNGDKPFSFKMGNGEVIKGWEVAIKGMRVGGKRRMRIPPRMAFGAKGNDSIPKDATLRFVVELLSVS